jgi:hypothetical protein
MSSSSHAQPDTQARIEEWMSATRKLAHDLRHAARGTDTEARDKAIRSAMALEQAAVFVELAAAGLTTRVTLGS